MKKIFLFSTLITFLFSCNIITGDRVDGDGNLSTDARQLNGFTKVASSGSIDVVLKQSSDFSVQVKGDRNLLQYILTDVDGNTLKIKTKPGYNLHPKEHLEVYVSAPVYNAVSSDGSGNVTTENTLTNTDKMSFELSGSGNVEAKIDAPSVESHTSGSGDVSFSGKAGNIEVSVAGSGNIECFGLTSENAHITINGSGNANVYATKQIDLTVNGSGDIRYKGGASVNSHINGSGSVSKAD